MFEYFLGVLGAIIAGSLMYDGLTSKEDKRRKLLLVRRRIKSFRILAKEAAISKDLDILLKNAGNPMGLNAFRYQMIRFAFTLSFLFYYFIIPLIVSHQLAFWPVVIFVIIFLATSPKLPFSAFSFIIRKLTDIYKAKKNNEIFQLHDLLISEFELMEIRQVNTYHVMKRLYKNFVHLQPELQELLQPINWKGNPTPALEKFANQVGTTEANMLVNILSKFDKHTDREIAISSLESNSKLFGIKQRENYRTRQKLISDLILIPIFFTHMFIFAVFMAPTVIMSLQTLQQSSLSF